MRRVFFDKNANSAQSIGEKWSETAVFSLKTAIFVQKSIFYGVFL